MADLAKYQQEFQRFNTKYVKEAVKEPINFWGLAGFAVAAAYTLSPIPLFVALLCELIYVVFLPMVPSYRQLVNRRENERLRALNKANREKLIKSFTPREREAVEYLRWQKDKIQENYHKFTGTRDLPTNLSSLDQRWEDFVDLLDVYRRRKQHLKSINRQAVHNQLRWNRRPTIVRNASSRPTSKFSSVVWHRSTSSKNRSSWSKDNCSRSKISSAI